MYLIISLRIRKKIDYSRVIPRLGPVRSFSNSMVEPVSDNFSLRGTPFFLYFLSSLF